METGPAVGQQGLLRNMFWLLGGNLAAQVLAAAMGLLLARAVGPHEYGLYAMAFSLAMAFAYTALMGLDSIVPREVARNPGRAGRVALSALIPALLWFPILVSLILGAGMVLGYSLEVRALLLPAALITGIRGLVGLFRSALRGLERMELDAAVQGLENGLALVIVGGGLLLSPSVQRALWAMLGAEALSLILAGMWVRQLARPVGWEARLARDMVVAALPLGLTFTLVGLNMRVDTLVLSLFQPAREVGLYNAAISLVMLSRSVSLMAATFLPRLSSLAQRDESAFARLRDQGLLWMLIPGIGIGVTMSLLSPFLMVLLYGIPFLPAAPVLRVLGVGTMAVFLNAYFWQVLIARGEQGIIARTTAVSLIISLALAIVLVPLWGALGAAGAVLTREVVQSVLLSQRVLRQPPSTLRRGFWAPFLGAAGALALTLWPAREATGPVVLAYLAPALAVYLAVLAGSRIIPAGEWSRWAPFSREGREIRLQWATKRSGAGSSLADNES
ncbi:MAG: flippase [Thermoflexales bacterium]|nr:flippase [Thermoflexales bacterium]